MQDLSAVQDEYLQILKNLAESYENESLLMKKKNMTILQENNN